MVIPPTWIADTYLGRAPSGRSRVLRLRCHESEERENSAEFFVKTLGLPEITEQQAARIYLFDMLVQNPDRRRGNENCFAVHGTLAAIDFAESFSFLYPVFGKRYEPWRVPAGISAPHVFRGTLERSSVEWPMLFERVHEVLESMPETPMSWLPKS